MQIPVRLIRPLLYAFVVAIFCLMFLGMLKITGQRLTWPSRAPTTGDVVGLVIGTIVFIGAVAHARRKANETTRASSEYRAALEHLKENPNNPQLRQDALALGRVYSNLSRNHKGVTLFDEVALSNDINAACAASIARPVSSASLPPTAPQARLEKLLELKLAGLLTEEEYEGRRTKILDEI